MELLEAVFLGIVQGLTEFLPISSSGHLVIFQNILNIEEPEIFFDICLHVGTLIAILIVYFRKVLELIKSCFDFNGIKDGTNKDFTMVLMIITGSIPTAAIGLFIKKYSHLVFSNIVLTGFMLLVTGGILISSKFFRERENNGFTRSESIKNALIIGVIQGFAVFPGISRSGSTIVTGLFLGLKRKDAASFSFLLSVPAILGAQLLSLRDVSPEYISSNLIPVLAGTFTSFLVGFIALKFLIKLVNRGKLYFFAPYCAFASGVCFVLYMM